ncbi:hypothetical protein BGK46_12450 [Salinivibrio sp. SS2]|nr:hypothetical protein BGK46_12450 [Salinivibrio sp. DV]
MLDQENVLVLGSLALSLTSYVRLQTRVLHFAVESATTLSPSALNSVACLIRFFLVIIAHFVSDCTHLTQRPKLMVRISYLELKMIKFYIYAKNSKQICISV